MRYLQVDTVPFTNAAGLATQVKEMREPPSYDTAFIYNKKTDDFLDELASRTDFYGEGHEGDAYKLFEANWVPIVEAGFDLTKVTSLVVPK